MGLLMQEIVREICNRQLQPRMGTLRIHMNPKTIADVQREFIDSIEAGNVVAVDAPPPQKPGVVMWILGVPVYSSEESTIGTATVTEVP